MGSEMNKRSNNIHSIASTSKSFQNNDIPLAHLPLRPTTTQLLSQRGFDTSKEIFDSKECGGIPNLASELGCTIQIAHDIYIEIVAAVDRRQKQVQHPNENDETNINSKVHKMVNDVTRLPGVSAMELLEQQKSEALLSNILRNRPIVTFCQAMDSLLGGGIPLRIVTEVAGEPGAGKSQLAMQLSVNVTLPTATGGVQGQAVYIDTEGSFSPERCYTMAVALIHHVQSVVRKRNRCIQRQKQQHQQQQQQCMSLLPQWDISPEQILDRIHVYRVHDEIELQTVLVGAVPELVKKYESTSHPIRLIVIDSIAFPFRSSLASFLALSPIMDGNGNTSANSSSCNDSTAYIARTRQLMTIVSELGLLATRYMLAVVAINQMTTKQQQNQQANDEGGSTTTTNNVLVPALGESWAHAVTIRLVLSVSKVTTTEQQQRRVCTLIKSPSLPPGSVEYQIVESGIRNIDYKEVPAKAAPLCIPAPQQQQNGALLSTATYRNENRNIMNHQDYNNSCTSTFRDDNKRQRL